MLVKIFGDYVIGIQLQILKKNCAYDSKFDILDDDDEEDKT